MAMVTRRTRRRHRAEGTALSQATQPNDLWCADYKGEFMLGNRQYCYPLTITDYRSRYLLACEGMASTGSDFAFAVFERTFKEFGLPAAIRTDNGAPFASGNALFGLSRLSVWLAQARHSDRTHQAGKAAAERPSRTHAPDPQAGGNKAGFLQLPPATGALRSLRAGLQQRASEPGPQRGMSRRNLYTFGRLYRPPEEPQYPFHDRTVRVTRCGRICIGKRKINLVRTGQVGLGAG
jgi:hypothetical protein